MVASTNDVMAELDIGFALEQLGAKVVYSALPVHPDSLHVQNIDRHLMEEIDPIFVPLDPDWKQQKELKSIVSYNSRIQSSCAQFGENIERHEPKFDAVILHNMDIKQESSRNAAIELTERIRERCPVIVCDFCDSKVAIQPLQDTGAKFFDLNALNFEPLAAAIADIVVQHNKSGRRVGG